MKRSKALIIGASGFVGGYLSQELTENHEIIAPDPSNDIRDRSALARVLNCKPDWVIHLAAISSVPDSFADPFKTFEVNLIGTLNLLVVLKESGFKGTFLYVGSSQVYGIQLDDEPALSETRPMRPVNPYAVSKLAAEALCFQWAQNSDFRIVTARPFNHIGPGQNEQFVIPNFAKQISEIKQGRREPVLTVGNVDVTRDFTDVRDVVRAYRLLLQYGHSGESYNVCSGVQTSIREIVTILLEISGIKADLQPSHDRFRATEMRRMFGSAEKLYKATGWRPQIGLHESLRNIFEYYDRAGI